MIGQGQLREAYWHAGVRWENVRCFDEDYELPATDWITGDFAWAYEDSLKNLRAEPRDNQWDCNSYALDAVAQAKRCWFRTDQSEAALAFGLASIGFHVLCTACHKLPDGTLGVAFYEPQEGMKPKAFTWEDLQTCDLVLFC